MRNIQHVKKSWKPSEITGKYQFFYIPYHQIYSAFESIIFITDTFQCIQTSFKQFGLDTYSSHIKWNFFRVAAREAFLELGPQLRSKRLSYFIFRSICPRRRLIVAAKSKMKRNTGTTKYRLCPFNKWKQAVNVHKHKNELTYTIKTSLHFSWKTVFCFR